MRGRGRGEQRALVLLPACADRLKTPPHFSPVCCHLLVLCRPPFFMYALPLHETMAISHIMTSTFTRLPTWVSSLFNATVSNVRCPIPPQAPTLWLYPRPCVLSAEMAPPTKSQFQGFHSPVITCKHSSSLVQYPTDKILEPY